MKVADVCRALEEIAPPALAEEWDNVGLLLGDEGRPCRRVLLTIDLTEAVLAEARRRRAQLVMAYHPVIFKPVTRLTARSAPIAWRAARAGLAVYSVHTAYDSAIGGLNDCLADALGMSADRRPLQERGAEESFKVVVFTPPADRMRVSAAAFEAGAGGIGKYAECSFFAEGTGTFLAGEGARPTVGQVGHREKAAELRLEMVCPAGRLGEVLTAIRRAHSYEEPAIDVYRLAAAPGGQAGGVGLGRVGPLARPASLQAMLGRIRRVCGVRHVQLAAPGGGNPTIRTLAVGGGSLGGLHRQAREAGAELYVTGEMRHHDALGAVRQAHRPEAGRGAAAGGLIVACVGHGNSERPALAPLGRRLRQALPHLEVDLSRADRDPLRVV